VQWQIDYPFSSEPVKQDKLNKIAAICSQKNFDKGHLLRNNFIKYLEFTNAVGANAVGANAVDTNAVDTNAVDTNAVDTNAVDTNAKIIDIWGRENYHQFKSYKGAVPAENKYNVYANYKYCVAVENNSEHNYATEKIWECILCESLCFYWGCPNLEEYIDAKAFVRLPLEDPIAALRIVQQALSEDWWSQRIEVIKQMKEKILKKLGFFPLMAQTLIRQV
jgi:hypothetical protein